MPELEHTWLVECFAPGIDDAAVAAAADRVREVVAGHRGAGVTYLGALLMAEDEVVFHAFRAPDVEPVRSISAAAGLPFERVVESIGVLPGLPVPDDPARALDIADGAVEHHQHVTSVEGVVP
jgi:hypothetical protein